MAEKDDGETQKEKSIYKEILDWSKDRPKWQRDALRRIVQSPIGDEDADEILLLCKQENGLESLSTASLTPVPLAAQHLPSTDPLEDDVVLTGMNDIQNVNAIGSNGLSFSPVGLNIIYGENGAGKSGYARVLKNACRARGSKPVVWPNAFKPSPSGLPSARIDYVEGGASKEFAWAEDASCPPELSRISVFDSKCAPVYITKDNEVAYLPCGLDILPSLARLCDDIRARLKKESALLMDSQLNGLPEELKITGTAIWLRNLSHATAQSDVAAETLFS
ncbi:MAG: ATP-binding protein, partial [Deltaproteobacteria bacterium]|nr:ATP-binding protein [Deltaproteobacteria bacterium]